MSQQYKTVGSSNFGPNTATFGYPGLIYPHGANATTPIIKLNSHMNPYTNPANAQHATYNDGVRSHKSRHHSAVVSGATSSIGDDEDEQSYSRSVSRKRSHGSRSRTPKHKSRSRKGSSRHVSIQDYASTPGYQMSQTFNNPKKIYGNYPNNSKVVQATPIVSDIGGSITPKGGHISRSYSSANNFFSENSATRMGLPEGTGSNIDDTVRRIMQRTFN